MTNFASLTSIPLPVGTPQQSKPTAVVPPAGSPKLRQAAAQFESSFMQELLKPFQKDPLFADDKGSDGEIGGSLGTIDSMGTQAMADALAQAGGLGIAKHILQEMAPIEAAQTAATQAATTQTKGAVQAAVGVGSTGLTMGTQKIR